MLIETLKNLVNYFLNVFKSSCNMYFLKKNTQNICLVVLLNSLVLHGEFLRKLAMDQL